MITHFEQRIDRFLDAYSEENKIVRLWKKPIVRFADANGFHQFLPHVHPSHRVPQDYLPEATVVLSVYLPFEIFVEKSNRGGDWASPKWEEAYITTNTMAVTLCEEIAREVEVLGYKAAIPVDAGDFTEEEAMSRWSQRHIAWLAGHGTFGLNNMLISDVGCTGRYFSVVTNLPVEPGKPIEDEERCLYKRVGSCGVCATMLCPVEALTLDGFDRHLCLEHLKQYKKEKGKALVCGKCDVQLPCSHKVP